MCIWDPDMSPLCSPLTHSIHYGKRYNMIKSSNATIPDSQHTSRGLSIYRGSVCLMSPTHMPNNHIMWYLLDTQHILLTLVFFYVWRNIWLIPGTCVSDPNMSRFCPPLTHSIQYGIGIDIISHLMRQFQIPNTHLVDSQYIAVHWVSCFRHTCQINTQCDISQTPNLFCLLLIFSI